MENKGRRSPTRVISVVPDKGRCSLDFIGRSDRKIVCVILGVYCCDECLNVQIFKSALQMGMTSGRNQKRKQRPRIVRLVMKLYFRLLLFLFNNQH
jgi:hypothetical protein